VSGTGRYGCGTQRVRIGPMVTPAPRRRLTKLARETVTLDHRDSGTPPEVAALGQPPHNDVKALLQEHKAAGATWWLESPSFPSEPFESWLQRVGGGPLLYPLPHPKADGLQK